MKINARWSIEGGRGDFILVEHRPGKNPKTGEPIVSQSRSYHPTLEQCAEKISKVHALDEVSEDELERVIEEIRKLKNAVCDRLAELEEQS